jgi:molybdopterin-guanine dinucleotide biosynthesis protein A
VNDPPINFSAMIGVVLSGGQSSRMGQDKGLIKVDGKPWAKIAFEKLMSLGVPALISVNESQFQKYLSHFNEKELIVDRSNAKIGGPLAGVMSVHLSHPNEDVIVLACDMINVEAVVLKKLNKEYQQHRPEAIAFKGDHIEPLCAIYSARALKKVKEKIDTDSLHRFSMTHLLEISDTLYLPILSEWQTCLKSINRMEDSV